MQDRFRLVQLPHHWYCITHTFGFQYVVIDICRHFINGDAMASISTVTILLTKMQFIACIIMPNQDSMEIMARMNYSFRYSFSNFTCIFTVLNSDSRVSNDAGEVDCKDFLCSICTVFITHIFTLNILMKITDGSVY